MQPLKDKLSKLETAKANTLARSYSPLLYYKKLKELLESVMTDVDFSSYQKYDLHQYLNLVLCSSYAGEELVKYYIARKYLDKKTVGSFELKVRNSRADFVSINGVTKCYEIKTELDNLYKLGKQMGDYRSVFEYNSVILDKKHLVQAKEMLPMEVGIFSIEKGRLKCIRSAVKNENFCPKSQLEMLTTKELLFYFEQKKENIENILQNFSAREINKHFKSALKNRYVEKWEFVKLHRDEILPIDFQFFFSTKESPTLLYKKQF